METDRKLIKYGAAPDVTFVFPNDGGALLMTEKSVLMKNSEVFQKQFASAISTDKDGKISIMDISYDTFNLIIQYFYNESFPINAENYQGILYASKKYFINTLITKVAQFLLNFITYINIVEHFEFLEKFEIGIVNAHMKGVIVKQPVQVIQRLTKSPSHMRILQMILESDVLYCSEFQLYLAIKNMMIEENGNWKSVEEIEEKFKNDLGNLMYLIRFPNMTAEELIKCSVSPTLLTNKQKLDLIIWAQEKVFSESLLSFSTQIRINPVKCKYCGRYMSKEYL
ncbi:uncharacterized protein LOC129809729 [Phlebotomus papatasi]|uniref:uncharacterized protein LOC129809729 n=1 Tax=Phlebotomus papatasi TaxID=29031 RepID=UPI0024833D68|nr:uncharacterized protein LOC129809729 [Phlebotomus papatasi]XP_055715749.1 uncharacterized protein LOC129809729 [Phlebotomus papatasi]